MWNETFTVYVQDYNHDIKFTIYEKDTFSDEFIASGSINPKMFSTPETTREFVRGHKDNKETA